MDAHVSGMHPLLARIVLRCLEKRPEARFQSAHDLAFALEAGGHTSSAVAAAGDSDASRVRDGRRSMPLIVIGALIVLTAAGAWLASGRAQPAPMAAGVPAAFTYALPDGAIFTRQPGCEIGVGEAKGTRAGGETRNPQPGLAFLLRSIRVW